MIGIIDYGTGNLKSVYNAFKHLNQDVKVAQDAGELASFSKIVLPGVGSSVDAMKGLEEKGFISSLKKELGEGKPFLGICLGLQLLFEKSSEGAGCKCLDIADGEVKLFPKEEGIKIPQIGWNTVSLKKKDCPLFEGIPDNTYFYFVHSYYCGVKDVSNIAGETEYGINYCSAFWRENIFATQFHPERSQEAGLKILENFIKI